MVNNNSLWKEQSETLDIRGEKDNEHKELVKANNRRLDNFILQNSSVNNELARNYEMNNMIHTDIDGDVNIIPTEVITRASSGKTSQVTTMCSFFYGEDVDPNNFTSRKTYKITAYAQKNVSYAHKITAYDRRVYNAMCTLYFNKRFTVTLNEIYSVMTGYKRKNPGKEQMESIKDCLDKLNSITVSIDLTDEINANIIKDKKPLIEAGIVKNDKDKIKRAIIEDKMIHTKRAILETENEVFTPVQILEEPALLTYNRAKKTLITIPMKFFGLANTSSTEKSIAFQEYLLIRIMSYKNGKMNSNKILYDSLYKNSGELKPSDSKGFIRDRKTIKKMLEEWKKGGLIVSYEEFKKGNSFAGISFELEKSSEERLPIVETS